MKKDSHITTKLADARASDNIFNWCEAAGLSAYGWARLDSPVLVEAQRHLELYLEQNHHATMGWMERPERLHPQQLWAEAKSALVLGASYKPDEDPLTLLEKKEAGTISAYALSEDYHRVLSKKTKAVAQQIQQTYQCAVKTFVDTAPLMEKPLGAIAGLGWQGKHSNLVSKQLGSWFFLSVILTDLELAPPRGAHEDHCGSCSRCLDICPTNAFVAPYQLDSRKCISYLTIEHKGHIDRRFRKAIGNRIYGCDDCLAVCPWNKFAASSKRMAELAPHAALQSPPLADLLALNEEQFRARFHHNPIRRIGHTRFLRNVLIAIGNSHSASFVPSLMQFITHAEPLLRAAAVWAMAQLAPPEQFEKIRKTHAPQETDKEVLAEWHYKP